MELVNMEKRHSNAYIGSVYSYSKDALDEIALVRSTIKKVNAYLKRIGATNHFGRQLKYRVSLRGRQAVYPVINPHTGRENSYNVHGDCVGGIWNAGRIDIYIHERDDWKRDDWKS